MKSSFADLQINGMLGVDFSSPSLDFAAVLKVTDAVEARGTGVFLATVVTSAMESYERTLPLLASFIESAENRGRMIGIHLEGPFISPEDGAVGAHMKSCVAKPSVESFDKLAALCGGRLKLITVAPEREGALPMIRRAVESGVAVSVGHSLANYEQALAAGEAGATLCTHVGNGIPNMIPRHKNPVIADLASPLTAMMIADGHHLPPEFLKLALMAKGLKSALIVSDCATVAGLEPGVYESFGTKVRVCEDGAIRNLNAPTLAGSSASMRDCMNFLAKSLGLDEKSLWTLGRDNPLRAIGIDPKKLKLPPLVEFKDGAFELTKKS